MGPVTDQSSALVQAMKATSVAVDRIINKSIGELPDGGAELIDAMQYAALSPGKRLRPFLVVCSAEVFGVDRMRSLRVGAAIECIHSYSLVHDDLPSMDDDDLRRGQPAVHKKFNEATAILAGDALLTLAFEILSDPATHPDGGVRSELCYLFAKAAGCRGMVGGQMMDLNADLIQSDKTAIHRMQQMKTGALLCAAVDAGAILGRVDDKMKQSLHFYAKDLGVAFQIADDILDVEGEESEVGKAVGKDDAAGKATVIGLFGLERSKEQARILADQAVDHLADFGEKAALLRAVAYYAVNRRT